MLGRFAETEVMAFYVIAHQVSTALIVKVQ